MNSIIKKLRSNINIISLIEDYITKAEDNLKNEFKENGITLPDEAVEFVNEVEDGINKIDEEYIQTLTSGFSLQEFFGEVAKKKFEEKIKEMNLETQYADMFHDTFDIFFKSSLNKKSKNIDKDIVITDYTKSTKEWLGNWSHELAEIINTNNGEAVSKILNYCLDENKTIKDVIETIVDEGIRSPGYPARRLAITETYRINNYSEMEAMRQNPAVKGKKWIHTTSGKNARRYHKRLDGITIGINETFSLNGINGGIHHPMAPHDTCLPVEEVANCGCKIEPQTAREVLKLSEREKSKLQEERIKAENEKWEKEFNERNKRNSGIDFDRVKLDWVKKKSKEEQIKYFGGNHSGKARKALIDSKVITDDKELNELYKRNEKGKRQLKTLKELENDGIITVREKALKHSVVGTYKPKSNEYPNGRLFSGGHSFKSIEECKNKGIKCSIIGEYSNGVKFGNVPTAKLKENRYGSGHTWFPKNWTDDDILNAGTFVANKPKIDNGYEKIGIYKGVAVRVLMTDTTIDSIHPVKNQSIYIKGVDLK